jgi:hypothetical protein
MRIIEVKLRKMMLLRRIFDDQRFTLLNHELFNIIEILLLNI